jgi:hypothetical protein
MKRYTTLVVGLALTFVAGGTSTVQAQQDLPLAPVPPRNLHVSPFFEGWYQNPDGTFTLSFGYYNRNSEESMEIPLGADNFIEPAEFDGQQPTHFDTDRQRGAFAVTVPASMAGTDVVWTLRNRGGTYFVPGRVTSPAYDLGVIGRDEDGNFVFAPMAEGSVPPAVRFEEGGPFGRGPGGIFSDQTLNAAVGAPLSITLFVDDSAAQRPPVPLNATWFKHSGPGEVVFDPEEQEAIPIEEGRTTTNVTFSEPGEYVVRGRIDTDEQGDSSPSQQCCWTNAYVRVQVE